MKVIVGLGNPGKKYEKTKHNVGFMVLDQLAKSNQATFKKSAFEAEVAEYFANGEKIILVKPLTYMNESGRSVGPLLTYFNGDADDVVVIYDDLDLAPGKIRLRQKGSAGGHNGIKSLIAHLQTQTFKRVKVGIGRPHQNETVVNHVLSPFNKETQPLIDEGMAQAVAATEAYVRDADFIATMNAFN